MKIKTSSSSNLRIHFDYQSSFTNSTKSSILQTTIMEPARVILESVIMPKARNNGILLVDRLCYNDTMRLSPKNVSGCAYGCTETTCIGVAVPDKYLKTCTVVDSNGNIQISGTQGPGNPNADIVLLVTYTNCGESTLAYAASCFMESTLNRPILGVVNLCSDFIIPGRNIKRDIKVVTHEIIHALGFAVDKYAFFRYENADPIVPRNRFGLPDLGVSSDDYYNWNEKIIKPIIRQRESVNLQYTVNFYGFVLPNVLAAARNHFNCSSLEAVDLENYGSLGSAMSHFDEYFLSNEIMTPESHRGTDVLSKITLALLQDTGWYNVNYAGVEDLDYGYKSGCHLPEGGCYKYMKSKPFNMNPFCNIPFGKGKTLGCSLFKNYFHYCNLKRMDTVSQKNQYFTSIPGVPIKDVANYSGPSPYDEYCPGYLIQSDPSFLCNDQSSNGVPNLYNSVPSYFGPDSMCFLNSIEIPKSDHIYGASCQKYISSKNSTEITIFIGNNTFKCPSIKQQSYTLSDGTVVLLYCSYDNFFPKNYINMSQPINSNDLSEMIKLFIFMIIFINPLDIF